MDEQASRMRIDLSSERAREVIEAAPLVSDGERARAFARLVRRCAWGPGSVHRSVTVMLVCMYGIRRLRLVSSCGVEVMVV